MSVGGKVIGVIWHQDEKKKWVNTIDKTGEKCAVYVEASCPVKCGDSLWWQGSKAYHTPKPNGRERIWKRIGFSGVKSPN